MGYFEQERRWAHSALHETARWTGSTPFYSLTVVFEGRLLTCGKDLAHLHEKR